MHFASTNYSERTSSLFINYVRVPMQTKLCFLNVYKTDIIRREKRQKCQQKTYFIALCSVFWVKISTATFWNILLSFPPKNGFEAALTPTHRPPPSPHTHTTTTTTTTTTTNKHATRRRFPIDHSKAVTLLQFLCLCVCGFIRGVSSVIIFFLNAPSWCASGRQCFVIVAYAGYIQ